MAGEAEPASALLVPVTHSARPPEHTGAGCQMNTLVKTHTHEETLETKVRQRLTACPLLSDFISGFLFLFFSAIKVFGLVLYRMSGFIQVTVREVFMAQRSQASGLCQVSSQVEPSTWERRHVVTTFQKLHLSVCATCPRVSVSGSSEDHCAVGRGLETSLWNVSVVPETEVTPSCHS